MKGIVFTELLEMIENKYGYELVDKLLTENQLPSGGIYTSIGTYEHAEVFTLLNHLSQYTDTPVPDLMRSYGRYMFATFTRSYYQFIERAPSAFSLLSSVQQYVHVEVRKLYPEAELPSFTIDQPAENHLRMRYESERRMADFAHGLIEGCLLHYGETATIKKTDLNQDGTVVMFDIVKQ